MLLRMRSQHVRLLKEEARKTHPLEACALLFGESTEEHVIMQKVVVTPNRLRSTKRFEVDPELVVRVIAEAEKEGLDFIGLFHSHPAPATPSTIDLKFMRLWGSAIWLILSSLDGKLGAYRMKDGKVEELKVGLE